MKFRLFIRTAIVISIALLCVGFAVFSYLQMNMVENKREFNLYTLVPEDAVAVLETDRMEELVSDINNLQCSKDNHFLYVSELFVCLKQCLHTLVGDTPHGFSRQMNKMLLSFHGPDDPLNQVLYCSLGGGDYELVNSFVRKYSPDVFASRNFEYQGEEIRIYPMPDGRFLSTFVKSDFLAVSFQKHLVEKVIDAWRGKRSLVKKPTFCATYKEGIHSATATVFARLDAVQMGRMNDSLGCRSYMGEWVEFGMEFKEKAVYCSGTCMMPDSVRAKLHIACGQAPLEGFGGECLPASTFYYAQWALADVERMARMREKETQPVPVAEATADYEEEWLDFLKEHSGTRFVRCFFLPEDSSKLSHAVMCLPLHDERKAARALEKFSRAYQANCAKEILSGWRRTTGQMSMQRPYLLPCSAALMELVGKKELPACMFASLYRGRLLLSSQLESLQAYVDAMDRNEVLEGAPLYEEGIGSLSHTSHFVMMADVGALERLAEDDVRLIPTFFFQHARFFTHFVLFIQYSYLDNVASPNVVLLYKDRG